MNYYDCKVGDVVALGDSYGYDTYICIQESHPVDHAEFNMVKFINLTDGCVEDFGCHLDYSYLQDSCRLIDKSPEKVDAIKKAWGITIA